MSEERLRILEMVREGKITSEEALKLIDALAGVSEPARVMAEKRKGTGTGRMLRVRIHEAGGNRVNVNVPLGLLKSIPSFIKMIPTEAADKMREKGVDLTHIDLEGIIEALEAGLTDGRLVDIEEEGGDKVEVYID